MFFAAGISDARKKITACCHIFTAALVYDNRNVSKRGHDMNDDKLLRLLRQDPQKGLTETVRAYTPYVYKIVGTRLAGLCTAEDMEEAVSDIFMKFYRGGQACRFEINSVRAYISAIAQRHCIDLMRAVLSREREVPLDEKLDDPAAEVTAESRTELIDAVKRLGEPDSSIIIRRYYFGQTGAEIARDLGMKENTVNKRISRCLPRLKQILEEEM